jgi:hypothetical protein
MDHDVALLVFYRLSHRLSDFIQTLSHRAGPWFDRQFDIRVVVNFPSHVYHKGSITYSFVHPVYRGDSHVLGNPAYGGWIEAIRYPPRHHIA